jgi:aldose 1-epimerase
MVDEAAQDAALRLLGPGELIGIGNEQLAIRIAPSAGGRIAQMCCEGVDWLCDWNEDNAAAIGWGSYPMVPWAGRIRRGRFRFDGRDIQLPLTLGAHAIHGTGFMQHWQVAKHCPTQVELSLQLPRDARWPFGGTVHQRVSVAGRTLRMELSLTAAELAMPRPVLGWHPWFRKPERLDFNPASHYPRDAEGIATLPLAAVPPGPWDDCFINERAVILYRARQALRLSSDCDHWTVFDERAHATCMEPHSGPPDAFNLDPRPRLEPGESVAAWFLLEWLRQPAA